MPMRHAVTDEVLVALRNKEAAAMEASIASTRAHAMYQIAVAEYVAVRNVAAMYVGKFPYSPDVVWPDNVRGHGLFRFAEMSAGDAAVAALIEANAALSAEDITARLNAGAGPTDFFTLRAITAALRQTGTVEVLPDGRYRMKEIVDPDDLPFE